MNITTPSPCRKRPARWASAQGLLLVEAVLAATVIAVGLVFITRALGSQLQALKSLQVYHALLPLAEGKLAEMESRWLFGVSNPADREGSLDQAGGVAAPDRWMLQASPRADLLKNDAGEALVDELLLSARHESPPQANVRLRTLWPSEWFSGS